MTPHAALVQFVDDELLRAPLLAEQLAEETLHALRREPVTASSRVRAVAADLQRALQEHRPLLVREFVQALGAQVRQLLGTEPRPLPPEESTPPRRISGLRAWRLVDETQVEQDVEVARVIEAIRNEADHELRELMTFTSALVGDQEVAHDHNPFPPDVMARALWQAVQALPMPRNYQLGLMRHACVPLAQLLRKFYAGACARLEGRGLEPAIYRTIIVRGNAGATAAEAPAEPRPAHPAWTTPMPGPSGRPRPPARPLPLPLRPMPPVPGATRQPARPAVRPAGAPVAPAAAVAPLDDDEDIDGAQGLGELMELISSLFEAMTGDRRLDEDIQSLLARLQTPAVHLAWRDPTVLNDYAHPLWLLMDRMALQGALHPPPGDPERTRLLRMLHGLLDSLADSQDPDALRWARDRVLSYERTRFEQRRRANEPELHSLQLLENQAVAGGPAAANLAAALDVPHLDTVPAELLDELPADPAADADDGWLERLRSGDWVNLFMQGSWVQAQLLWYGAHREYWLLADGASSNTWAVRRRALERLLQMRLLTPVTPRSLIRDAANRVLRQLAEASATA